MGNPWANWDGFVALHGTFRILKEVLRVSALRSRPWEEDSGAREGKSVPIKGILLYQYFPEKYNP